MKLAEANTFARLREDGYTKRIPKEIKNALELAVDIFAEAEEREQPFLYHTPETWARKWLPSKKFRLMRLPLNAAAMPCEPKGDNLVLKKIHAMEAKPIVVDYNRNQVGKSFHGFVPQVIVIDGKHRFKAAALRGETHIMAWVGELAAESMQALGGGGPAPEHTAPASGAKLVAQGSSRQETRLANRMGTYAEGKKLKTLNVKKIISEYQKDRTMGRVTAATLIKASVPPEWEDTVKELKKHPEVDNPYALANWMDNKGYTPGGDKK